MNKILPQITYFCELDPQPLQALFANPEVTDFLCSTHAAVSLGILDLSEERAGVVHRLNDIGIPVTAWLLLPKNQGYWFNLDNSTQAVARYVQFKSWSKQHNLRWTSIGLDIEPDIREMKMLANHPLAVLQRLMQNALNMPRLRRGSRAYHELVELIHRDGFPVETYQFPFITDEREAESSLVQRLTGLVDLPEADCEVLMLYSSFVRPWGPGILWSYAPGARGIGIGSTGGGVEMEGTLDVPPLNWAELQTDLLLAHKHNVSLYVFSLEGCAQQNLLPRLRELDWQQPVQVPYTAAQKAENIRKAFRRALWFSARPAWLLFGLALLVSLITLITRRRPTSN